MRRMRVKTGMIHILVDKRKKRKNRHDTDTGGEEEKEKKRALYKL